MSNEITVRSSLQIKKGNLQYRSVPTGFNASMGGSAGPTPGTILATTQGTDVSLAALTAQGGWAFLQNLDTNNTAIFGVYDSDTLRFYPVLDLLPGEEQCVRLSQFLGTEYVGTGTVVQDTTQTFRVKALNNPCYVRIDAFDK